MIRILLILFLLTGCSQQQVRTHIGTGAGVVTGFMTCHELLQANIELTAACTLVGGMLGSSMFYKNDMNVHTAVFVDTLNTTFDKISHTNWGNVTTGNWGSVTINRTYLTGGKKCREYESVISIKHQWTDEWYQKRKRVGCYCLSIT